MSEQTRSSEARLEGWKAIAAYLNRETRTAKRWEVAEALPVHRHRHFARSSVYAFPSELDAWRANRRPDARARRESWLKRSRHALILLPTLTAALTTVGGGRVIGPMFMAAQTVSTVGITSRVVLERDYADQFGSVSPDGRHVSFMDETRNLAVYELATGQRHRVTSKPESSKAFAEYSIFSPTDHGSPTVGAPASAITTCVSSRARAASHRCSTRMNVKHGCGPMTGRQTATTSSPCLQETLAIAD
jgi:hypothetical protein